MTYQDFKETIRTMVQRQLGVQYRVVIQDMVKNNNTHLDGLVIMSEDSNLSPTIYLNHYYRQYEKSDDLKDICQEIVTIYREHCPSHCIDISFFTDYDKVKSRIVFKLVNYEKNRALLEKIPHYRFLDLAIVFNCLLNTTDAGNATILIYERHLSLWGITRDDLYALAASNTPKLLQYDLRNMTDVMRELFSDTCPDEEDFDTAQQLCPMYVLTNRQKLNGSVCILYKDLLRDFSRRLESDLYILPSSIHEVLIIPAGNTASGKELSDMVKEVNATQLSGEEILSDHVYYFSRETCQLTM